MNRILSLIKTDINNSFGLSAINLNRLKKANKINLIAWIVLAITLLPMYFYMIKMMDSMYAIYNNIGQKSMFLMTGFLISQVIIFVFGILYVMSKYYFSNDLSTLVPMPLKPWEIIGSKFASLMVSEYLTSLPIILPFIFIYGIKGGEGILYWMYSILLTLFLPVIPLVLASILVMFFMKYTNIGAKKDLIRLIGTVVFVALMVAVQLTIQKIATQSLLEDGDFIANMITDANILINKMGIMFPPSKWAALGLSGSLSFDGFFSVFSFLLVSIISFIIMIMLSGGLFFGGLMGNMEVSVSRNKKVDLTKAAIVNKPYMALAKKEIIMLFKTPIYAFNTVGGVVLVPVILVASVFSNLNGMSFSELQTMIASIIEGKESWVVLGGVAAVVSLCILNSVGPTSFSREGTSFWIQRTLPIKPADQIIGRVLSSLFIQLIGVIILFIGANFIIKIDLISMLLILLLGMLGSVVVTEIGLLLDALKPYLTWDNPQKAIKQNFNVLIAMGITSAYTAGVGFLTIKLLDKININIIYLMIFGILTISAFILFKILKLTIDKLIETNE